MCAPARGLLVRLRTQRFSQIRLLATIALSIASAVSTHAAASDWTGLVSSDWFLAEQLDRRSSYANDRSNHQHRDAEFDRGRELWRKSPKSLRRGKRDRDARNPKRRNVDQFWRRDNRQSSGRGGHCNGDRRRAPSGRTTEPPGRRSGHGHPYHPRWRHGDSAAAAPSDWLADRMAR